MMTILFFYFFLFFYLLLPVTIVYYLWGEEGKKAMTNLEKIIVDIVDNCLDTMKRIKGCEFQLEGIEKPQKLAGTLKEEKDKRKSNIHLVYKGEKFEILLLYNKKPDDAEIEKVSKELLTELNKARNDIDSGKPYEPTYMRTLKDLLNLPIFSGGFGDWYQF